METKYALRSVRKKTFDTIRRGKKNSSTAILLEEFFANGERFISLSSWGL